MLQLETMAAKKSEGASSTYGNDWNNCTLVKNELPHILTDCTWKDKELTN